MRRLDQVIGGEVFRVDETACSAAAGVIRNFNAASVETPWSNRSKSVQLLFKLAFVSICHQINWDFLQHRMAVALLERPREPLTPSLLSAVDAKDVQRWLEGYEKPERIRAPERAAYLRDIGRVVEAELKSDPTELYNLSQGRISGEGGFLQQLDRFKAFGEDPLKKKSNVLLQELTRERILCFEDERAIAPAIDYHIMRLYLRTGRVIATSLEIKEKLKENTAPRLRLINELRRCVAKALDLTAWYAGLSVATVNYIEWQIGRSVCVLSEPSCVSGSFDENLDPAITALFSGPCPYVSCCEAYKSPEWRALREPELKTKAFY